MVLIWVLSKVGAWYHLCKSVVMLRKLPRVPKMPVMKVRMPEIRNLYSSVLVEYSSGLPHFSTMLAGNIKKSG